MRLETEQCYREIVEVLDKNQEDNVLLDFGKVKYLSSTALGMLIRVLKKCKEYKIRLKLCNLTLIIIGIHAYRHE